MEILNITRPQAEGLVCYGDLNDEETTLIWYDPQTSKGEIYTVYFDDDALNLEKGDIIPAEKPDFSEFEKITLEMFDKLAKEINDTIAEADEVEEV